MGIFVGEAGFWLESLIVTGVILDGFSVGRKLGFAVKALVGIVLDCDKHSDA